MDSAESAVGAMEEGLGEGAVAAATGGESSSAPAAQDTQPPPNTQPPVGILGLLDYNLQ